MAKFVWPSQKSWTFILKNYLVYGHFYEYSSSINKCYQQLFTNYRFIWAFYNIISPVLNVVISEIFLSLHQSESVCSIRLKKNATAILIAQKYMFFEFHENGQGDFHLVDLIITELMTCYKFKCSHWWKMYL